MAVWNIAVGAVERAPKNGFSASRVRLILARKPLAERVVKKLRAMDKKHSYGKIRATDNRKKSENHMR